MLEQFLRIAKDQRLTVAAADVPNEAALRKCILIGFSDRVARVDSGTLRCDLVHGRRGTLTRESVARASSLLVIAEINEIGGRPEAAGCFLNNPVRGLESRGGTKTRIKSKSKIKIKIKSESQGETRIWKVWQDTASGRR